MNAYLIRVTQEGHDFIVPLSHNEAGTYQQQLTFPLKGLWDIRIVATWKQQHYQKSKRIVVK
ncbi:MAG: FixH family protein [Rickettsiales bacterium]|nr:FixH family protein [Rickettsiales bacterium]